MHPVPRPDKTIDDDAYLSVVFVQSGGYTIIERDQTLDVGKGGAGWMPGWARTAGRSTEITHAARVSVPRESLLGVERGFSPLGLFEGPMMLTNPSLAFVRELTNRSDEADAVVTRQDAQPDDPGHPTAAVLTQLVSALFLEQKGYRLDSVSFTAGLWGRAVALIDQEYADPLLDPAALASRLHISLRHLQRAFSQNGGTIGGAIRDRRVDAAVAMLAESRDGGQPLSSVAAANGFSSIKEMRHALRARHGLTPSEFRSAASVQERITSRF